MRDPWEVDIKGGPDDTFEITVLRASNEHGKRSYGWMDDSKLFISGSGGPCRYTVPKVIFDKLVTVAYTTADELNLAEILP